jgi:hypothetical protein
MRVMTEDIVVLVAQLGFAVCLPFLLLRWARSRPGYQKVMKQSHGNRWLVLTICAGEAVLLGFILRFFMTFFLSQNQVNQLPVPMRYLGFMMTLVGTIGFLWTGMKFER